MKIINEFTIKSKLFVNRKITHRMHRTIFLSLKASSKVRVVYKIERGKKFFLFWITSPRQIKGGRFVLFFTSTCCSRRESLFWFLHWHRLRIKISLQCRTLKNRTVKAIWKKQKVMFVMITINCAVNWTWIPRRLTPHGNPIQTPSINILLR